MKIQIKNLFVAGLILLCITNAKSQVEFDYTGYIYNLPSYMKMPDATKYYGIETTDDYFLMDLTRFRLMPNLHFGENSRITMHYEMDMMWSKVPLPYLSNSGISNRQAIKLNWNLIDEEQFKANHYIDMLYFKQMIPAVSKSP